MTFLLPPGIKGLIVHTHTNILSIMQISMMELSCENKILTVNYVRKKSLSQMFAKVRNMPPILSIWQANILYTPSSYLTRTPFLLRQFSGFFYKFEIPRTSYTFIVKMQNICNSTGRNSKHISNIFNCYSANINRMWNLRKLSGIYKAGIP